MTRIERYISAEHYRVLDGLPSVDLDFFDFLPALAAISRGKGVGSDAIPGEVFKMFPWGASLHV